MRYKNLGWLSVSLLVIFLDQFTKYWAAQHLNFEEPLVVIPHCFNLFLTHNTGAAFSFLATMPGWQRWFFIGIAGVITVGLLKWLLSLPPKHVWLSVAISFVIGGAIGNLIDRVRLSYVIDFIQWYYKNFYWPAFNIADSAVVVGAVMIAGYYLYDKKSD